MGASDQPGFHGKLPSRGDFLTRGLPRAFVDPWDDWLQKGIAASREAMGEDWLQVYLESPVWRFALAGSVCGTRPIAGLFLPSVDKVGRYFPFTLAYELPADASPARVVSAADWYQDLEARALTALDDDALDPASFHEGLSEVAAPPLAEATNAPIEAPLAMVPIADAARAEEALAASTTSQVMSRFTSPALWWTNGSDLCAPVLLVSEGLPAASSFELFLTGRTDPA